MAPRFFPESRALHLESYLHKTTSDKTQTVSVLNCFKAIDVDQLIVALIFIFGIILV